MITDYFFFCSIDYIFCFIWIFQADIDNSGTIDYIEFIAATLHLNKLEREEHLVAAFSYFDKDGSGYITVDELQQACKEHNMPAAFLDDVIKEADQDNVSLLVSYINFTLDWNYILVKNAWRIHWILFYYLFKETMLRL